MSLLFTSYKEYKTYAKKYSYDDANQQLNKMLEDKYRTKISSTCIYCAFNALNEDGYISEEELRNMHDSYTIKKKSKMYKKMRL